MQPDKIGFAVFGESKNIETGRDTEMNIDMVPNFDAAADEPVCQLTIKGLYDAGGDDVCNVPIDVTEGINACSFGAVALATSGRYLIPSFALVRVPRYLQFIGPR